MSLTPEQQARKNIDDMFFKAGWDVQVRIRLISQLAEV